MLIYKFINNEDLFKQYYNKINLKSNNQMSSQLQEITFLNFSVVILEI